MRKVVYLGSVGPVMYAHILTRISVRNAPANPERIYLALKNTGSICRSAGRMYSAVSSAMTPAMKPKTATSPKTFNLSFNFFTVSTLKS